MSIPFASRAISIVHIPPAVNTNAVFINSPDRSSARGQTLVAAGDGARVVIGESILLIALKGSAFAVIESKNDNDQTFLRLEQGVFHIYAGNRPSQISIGQNELTVKDVEFTIALRENTWMAKTIGRSEDSRFEFRPPREEPTSEPPAHSDLHAFTINGERASISAQAERYLETVRARLTEPRPLKKFTLLDVEDPSDLQIKTDHTANDITDLEIEEIEIEIETDCIEICED